MLSIEEAERRITETLSRVPEELVSLPEAWNRVAARDVIARTSNPPADVSAMDGYAVRGADVVPGTPLRLVGEAAAGRPFDRPVGAGECARIFTGSVVPAGSDAVLIQEHAERDGESVRPTHPVTTGKHIRRAGQDFAVGTVLVPAGRRLGARDIGLIAAGNHNWVSVHRRPRILVAATGDEIVLPGEPATAGSIYNSNTPMLAALVRSAGGEALVLPPVADDVGAIAEALETASGIDLIVTAGGVSVGDYDLIRDALQRTGFDTGFWRIAMRPGKPLLYGTVRTRNGRLPVLGLPGNPVSAMICSLRFLIPAIRRLAGETDPRADVQTATLSVALPPNDLRADHLRAVMDRTGDAVTVAPLERQDSGMLRDLARADALILRPPFAPAAEAGNDVPIIRLDHHGI